MKRYKAVILVTGMFLVGRVVGPQAQTIDPDYVADMLYCDVVVRGVVQSFSQELRQKKDAMPMLGKDYPDAYVRVALVSFQVEETLRGEIAPGALEFVALVGTSAFDSDNYEVGRELVVGLVWGEGVLGGHYWLFSEGARLVHSGAGWRKQRGEGGMIPDLNEVRSTLRQFEPEVLAKEADVVVRGSIGAWQVESQNGQRGEWGTKVSIQLEQVSAIRGGPVPNEMIVNEFVGHRDSAWVNPAPFRKRPTSGADYCFFLKREGDMYVVCGGANGAHEIRTNRLYFSERTPIRLTISRIAEEQ